MKLFVYGTLKRGSHLDYHMVGCEFLGTATTSPVFKMFDLGYFPALVLADGYHISGEVYEVDSLDDFDRLEDFPRLYTRGRFDVGPYTAWIYYASEWLAGRIQRNPELTNGVWP